MNKIIEILKTEKFKTVATAIGAVIMYFTPPPYDAVITVILSAFGISTLVVHKKEECGSK